MKFKNYSMLSMLILIVIIPSCMQPIRSPGINYQKESNTVFVTIDDKALSSPLKITEEMDKSIYFETESGKYWLQGEPEKVEEKEGMFHGEWNVNDRKVTVEIKAERDAINKFSGKKLSMSFKADPDDGILGWGFSFNAAEDEYFTGLFERTVDGDQDNSWAEGIKTGMNLRGESVDMIIKPTLSLYSPFYISSRGYGLFVEGTWPGHYDICKENSKLVKIYFEGSSFESELYLSSEPKALVKAHSLNVGPQIVPPKWTFKPFRWRDNHHHRDTYYDGSPVDAPYNSEAVEDVLMMEALDIPFSVYWVDRPWAVGNHGYSDFKWDPERFPNAEKMLEWIHSKDKKFLLWIAPWIMGDMAKEAYEKEYFLPSEYMAEAGIYKASQVNDFEYLKKEVRPKLIEAIKKIDPDDVEDISEVLLGKVISEDDYVEIEKTRKELIKLLEKSNSLDELQHFLIMMNAGRVLIDFTNPEAVAWWQKNGPGKVIDDGVDAFKLDRAEEVVPEDRKTVAYDGRIAREIRNEYPVQYVKATYDIAKKKLGEDFVLMPRAGYTGSSKYAVFWGGDIKAPPEGLRAAIIAVQRSAVIGYPVWGSDIGGYWGGVQREVTARWLGFGCFTPIMELGPTKDRGLWDCEWEPGYDTLLIAIWRTYSKIHTSLADYTYKHAREAHNSGMPIVRPLFLEYPDQKEAWNDWQTYKYGSDILVSAIWQKGKTKHTLYLPEGEVWVDAWDTDKEYEGGRKITVNAPLHKIPIFIRKGSAVNLGDLNALFEESMKIAGDVPDIKKLEQEEFGK